ncbi:MAG: SAM-dependent methyltransferase, partial [Planctomycetes bacterium]|nr:SAM-dependent methyltransferase [Planctomycetota bacterium]
MDQAVRNKLRGVVTQCRKLLEDAVSQELQGKFGIYAAKKDGVQVDDDARMSHLTNDERAARKDILDHFDHIKARGFKPKDALDQLVREIAFTHLNRLCAYKMMEARDVYVGGQKFREAVSRGINSNGFKFYLADHPEDERLYNTGKQDVAYRHFLNWLGAALSEEIGVLFSPTDSANRLYPPQRVLDEVIGLLNTGDIKPEDKELAEAWPQIWSQDETIGWVYQYFTPKELRDQARKESAAPRNSYELAFRNQFFTPRYVVEFLTDNTLGRIWYEMRKGDTKLKDQCRYMVRRPTEIFLADGELAPSSSTGEGQG